MTKLRNYRVGPTLAEGERPWSLLWEQDPHVLACDHWRWETCLVFPRPGTSDFEEVVRCVECHAPRCGHTNDPDPCIERRHHEGPHIPASVVPEPHNDRVAEHFGFMGFPGCPVGVKCRLHGWVRPETKP